MLPAASLFRQVVETSNKQGYKERWLAQTPSWNHLKQGGLASSRLGVPVGGFISSPPNHPAHAPPPPPQPAVGAKGWDGEGADVLVLALCFVFYCGRRTFAEGC